METLKPQGVQARSGWRKALHSRLQKQTMKRESYVGAAEKSRLTLKSFGPGSAPPSSSIPQISNASSASTPQSDFGISSSYSKAIAIKGPLIPTGMHQVVFKMCS